MRYGIGFSYLEVLQISSGLGFTKTKDGVDFNHERSIDLIGILKSTNVLDSIAAWNMSINKWLKYYVYIRVIDKSSTDKKPGN
jgi:lysophospholipid acyltransferase